MTTTRETTTQAIVCPTWCTEGPCRGEHHATIADYMPATAGLPRCDYQRGTYFPAAGVYLSHDTIDDLDPCVVVHVAGPDDDSQLDLRIREAQRLVAALIAAIEVLSGRGDPRMTTDPTTGSAREPRGAGRDDFSTPGCPMFSRAAGNPGGRLAPKNHKELPK